MGPLIDEYYALNDSSGAYDWSSANHADESTEEEAREGNGDDDLDFGEESLACGVQSALEELGVHANSSWEEVQRAYRNLCKQYHPDTVASKDYPPHIVKLMEEKFKRMTQAYDFLREIMDSV